MANSTLHQPDRRLTRLRVVLVFRGRRPWKAIVRESYVAIERFALEWSDAILIVDCDPVGYCG